MSRKQRKKSESSGAPEWMVTYSDLVTLLLTFFVLLYSFSSVDASKFKQIADSLAQALGGTTGVITNGGNIGPTPITTNPGQPNNTTGAVIENKRDKEVEETLKNVQGFIRENDLETKVTIKEDARGIIIELEENILFDPGKADIKPQSLPVLDKLSQLLSKFPNEIIVEGHTDNVPINRGYYRSNWELSADRAVKVVRYLIEEKSLNPAKFFAVGAGEYKPIADNSTDAGRQKNRRVNILIVTSTKEGS